MNQGTHDVGERFGHTCPVCGGVLGAPVERNQRRQFVVPPSLRLEVGPPDSERRYPWRVRALDGRFRPMESVQPPFNPHEVDYVYLLCGGGHIFPDASPLFRRGTRSDTAPRQHVDAWNMVAAIGAPASGKTYLLLRTLHQSLDNPENWEPDHDDGRVRLYQLSPLEQVPLTARTTQYTQTVASGLPILPTLTDFRGLPAGILKEEMPDALDAIREMIKGTVVDGERQAQAWGEGFRQPLVLRTASRGRRTWTGVADLPGELFKIDTVVPRERVTLRAYDALVWVVDPVVAADAIDGLADDGLDADTSYGDVLDGSLRPGTTAEAGREVVRITRDDIQSDIGRSLTLLDGEMAIEVGAALQLLVAVSKCDMIHAALRKGTVREKRLEDLAVPGTVARGVMGYLWQVTNRWAAGRMDADEETAALLRYLRGGEAVEREVRRRRIEQVADALLTHFSRPEKFWNLVHGGRPDQLDVPGSPDAALRPRRVRVPSIGEHLEQALRPGSAYRVLLRDLVMSAVGCGVAYGLGQEDALFRMLREEWQNIRFFLCSPLGTVPRATGDGRLSPLEPGARFPRIHGQSAALTQLLLAMLGKARV